MQVECTNCQPHKIPMSVLETPSWPWDEGKQADNDSADSENKSGKEI